MSTETCDLLMDTLAEFSRLYPEMRFGQLVEMIALLASDETPTRVADVEDDRFFDSAARHMRLQRDRLVIESTPPQDRTVPESRTTLLDALQRACERHRDHGFGALIEHLATSAGSNLYDVEDEQLIAAARSYPIS
jgi:hypothetical protein